MSERRARRRVEFVESYWTGGEYGSDYIWNDNHGELIRCKDCKKRPDDHVTELNGKLYRYCELHRRWTTDDWFCADGERS